MNLARFHFRRFGPCWLVFQMLLLTSTSVFVSGCGTLTWASFDIADQVLDLGMVKDQGERSDEFRDEKIDSRVRVAIVVDERAEEVVPLEEVIEGDAQTSGEDDAQSEVHGDPAPARHQEEHLSSGEIEVGVEVEVKVDIDVTVPVVPTFRGDELADALPSAANEEKPAGPPLGVSAVRIDCDVTTEKVLTETATQSLFLKWPWVFGAAIPFSFFGSIALLAGSIWALDVVTNGEPATYLLASLSLAWVTYFIGDIVGLAMVINRGSRSTTDQTTTTTDWAREPLSCQGAFLVGGGFRIPLRPDGALDRWDEAYVVRAWAAGKGPTQVWLRDKNQQLKISKKQRCQWAEERDYDFEYCRR